MEERLIFHIDVNSAFLSWEAAERVKNGEEDLRMIPSVIGGDPKKRTGIVLAKSIPAKKFGIVTGEPMASALRKCPALVSAPADFSLYTRSSAAFKTICAAYAPVMESFSIDEVFLDMTGTSLMYPDPLATAHEIKNRIRDELGFTVNVGIGRNKLCAKMASDFEKPDKVHTLFPEEIREKLWPLPVRDLLFVGRATAEKLRRADISTIGDLANADPIRLQRLLGEKQGKQTREYANGIDDSPVSAQHEAAKGYSAETTVEENLEDFEAIDRMLLAQADIVSSRMRKDGVKCGCIAVSFRTTEFKNKSHQRTLEQPTDATMEIYEVARRLIRESWQGQPLRLIGLALTDLGNDEYEQLSLFENPGNVRNSKLDKAMDAIRSKYGSASIQRAGIVDLSSKVARKYNAQMEYSREEKE